MSPLLVVSAVADLVGLLFVAAVLAGLQQAFPRPHMRSWSWSWLAGAVRVAGGILAATLAPPLAPRLRWGLTLVILLAYWAQAAWLLVGTLELARAEAAPSRLRRLAWLVPTLLALVAVVAGAAATPLPVRTLLRFALPAAALALAALATARQLVRRAGTTSAVGVRLMAGALGLYGLVHVHDVVIHVRAMMGVPLPGYPAYLGFVDLALMTTLGLGAVVSLLDEEGDRLHLAEEKFARVFRSSPDAIVVTHPLEGGIVVDVNERFEQITGYRREEAVGRTTVELGLVEEADRLAIVKENPRFVLRDREVALKMKDGERRTFSLAAESFDFEGRKFAVIIARDVTDRLRAAAQLRGSEERLRLALDAAGLATWELDLATGVGRWSDGAEAVLGVAKERLPFTFESYLELVHPEERDGVRERLLGFFSGGRDELREEHRLVGDDGRIRWLEGRGRVERDASGRAVLVRGVTVDVSLRKEAEQALRESEERFRHLAAASFEGVGMSEGGVMFDANEQLASMLGCRVADLVDQPIRDFVAVPSREVVRAHLADQSGEPYQHLARRVDGSVFPVEVRARTVPYRGRTVRLSAVRDISERAEAESRQRRLEADLRQAAEEWRQTFDALDLAIVLADPDGHMIRLNRRALELLAERSSFDAVIGQTLDVLSATEPWRSLARLRAELPPDGGSLGEEARDAASGRSYYVLVTPWPREEGRPPWAILTFRDVTGFVAMQEQLRNARVMEAMGSLVAGVAHEVRNPLFSISATVDALEARFPSPPEFAEHAALLRSQVGRLTRLMRDLLDYGKPSLVQTGETHLADVVRRAARSCAPLAAERQVRVETDLAADLPTLRIDGARVEQACENLISNALQHAPAGSVVRVCGRVEPDRAPAVVLLTVEDEGPGVPAGQLARIFEPFFTRRKGGTGLGLSIVQRVVEAHGGEVTASNRASRGACFAVRLPLGPPAEVNELA